MMPSTVMANDDLDQARAALAAADAVVIGAGAGLSAAAGFDYTDAQWFAASFPFLTSVGFSGRHQLMGRMLPPRLQWGFWGKHVTEIRLGSEANPLYTALRASIGDRDHFVLTSNVDALFTRNGFDDDRVYTPQGDYALYQCLRPCTREVWDAREVIARCLADLDESTGETSAEAVPRCPNCSGPVHLNVNGGRFYIADHFQQTGERLIGWLDQVTAQAKQGARVVVLDLGSGHNTPTVVRWPMEKLTRSIASSTLIRVNRDEAWVPTLLAERSFSLAGDTMLQFFTDRTS